MLNQMFWWVVLFWCFYSVMFSTDTCTKLFKCAHKIFFLPFSIYGGTWGCCKKNFFLVVLSKEICSTLMDEHKLSDLEEKLILVSIMCDEPLHFWEFNAIPIFAGFKFSLRLLHTVFKVLNFGSNGIAMKGRKVEVFYFAFLFSFSLVCPRRALLFWSILYWQVIFAPSLSLLDPIHPITPSYFLSPSSFIPFPPSCQLFLHCLYPNASTLSFNYPN